MAVAEPLQPLDSSWLTGRLLDDLDSQDHQVLTELVPFFSSFPGALHLVWAQQARLSASSGLPEPAAEKPSIHIRGPPLLT